MCVWGGGEGVFQVRGAGEGWLCLGYAEVALKVSECVWEGDKD